MVHNMTIQQKFHVLKVPARILLVLSLLLSVSCGQEEQVLPESQKIITHVLTYAADDNGMIDGEVRQEVDAGVDGIEVTALPNEGYHFSRWSDGVSTPKRIDRDVKRDLSVTAEFAINQYALSYTVTGRGRLEGSAQQKVAYGENAEAVIASSEVGSFFVTWSDGVSTSTRIDRNVKENLTVTAEFSVNQYALTYEIEGEGRLEGAVKQTVAHGNDAFRVKAVPQKGHHFVKWSDGLEAPERIDLAVVGPVTVKAYFEADKYSLLYSAGTHGSIEGSLEQTVAFGDTGHEVTAVPEVGYHFVGWSDGIIEPARIDEQVKNDLAVEAVFEKNTYTVGGTVTGLSSGTTLVLMNSSGEELLISGRGPFSFARGLFDAENFDVRIAEQPSSPNQICTVNFSSGLILSKNITEIEVTCELETYSVGGTVSGLREGQTITLLNSGGDNLRIDANGPFLFDAPLEDGSQYDITQVKASEKSGLTCDFEKASGTLSGADVTDVAILCYIKPVLKTLVGVRQVVLDWNHEDFENVTYTLCRAEEDIPQESFRRCRRLDDGLLETRVEPEHVVTGLTNEIPYWFRLEVRTSDHTKYYSDVVQVMAYGGLNDSGVDWCADDLRNFHVKDNNSEKSYTCKLFEESFPGQDGHYGRDALARGRALEKQGQGTAGFDFKRMCRNGHVAGQGKCPPLPTVGENPNNWGCVKDHVTGLIWEVKSTQGLQSSENTYSWLMPKKNANGGLAGTKNAGRCQGSSCDTEAYIQAVNDAGLCGHTDWRLPTKRELLSIVDNSQSEPAIDLRFFPQTMSSNYWTSSSYANQPKMAWQVYLKYGETSPDEKRFAKHIRLVSGETGTFGRENP